MADKPAKAKKTKKSGAEQAGVLASLPATRPQRLGRRDGSAAPKREPVKAAKPAKPKATHSTAASRAATAEKAQRRVPRPASPPPPPPPPRSEPRKPAGPPKGPELITTAVQATGEIAKIGITVGGQVLRRAARRLPRP